MSHARGVSSYVLSFNPGRMLARGNLSLAVAPYVYGLVVDVCP